MQIVYDHRPSSNLSNVEVVAYLVKSIRAQGLTSAKQVKASMKTMFPDMSEDRKRECLLLLARELS